MITVSRYLWLVLRLSYKLNINFIINKKTFWVAWVAQSVKRPTSAQVMISQFVSSSPVFGCVLTAQSLAPASNL